MVMLKGMVHRYTAFLLSLALTATLVGCASNSSSTNGSNFRQENSAKPTAQANDDKSSQNSSKPGEQTIVIGAPFPLTGPWAEGGQNSLNGVELAVNDINAAGGIKSLGGAKLKLASADTSSNDPNQAASVTRRLIDDKAVALVGSYVSALSLTATTEAEKAQVPIITQSFVDNLTERGYKYTFQIPPKSSAFGLNSIQYISEIIKKNNLKISKVAFVANNDANSIKSIETGQQAAKEAGFNIVLSETFPPGITDATPVITKIKNANPELIFMAGVLQDEILVIRSMRAQNLNAPVLGLGGGGFLGKGFAKALGKFSDNAFSLAAWNWDLKNPGVADVNKRYSEKYNEPFMAQESGESYIGTWLIKEAIEKAASTDPKKIRDQLSTMDFEKGAMMVGGKVKFDDKGLNSTAYTVLIEWKDSLPHSVWPEKDKVMDAILK